MIKKKFGNILIFLGIFAFLYGLSTLGAIGILLGIGVKSRGS